MIETQNDRKPLTIVFTFVNNFKREKTYVTSHMPVRDS